MPPKDVLNSYWTEITNDGRRQYYLTVRIPFEYSVSRSRHEIRSGLSASHYNAQVAEIARKVSYYIIEQKEEFGKLYLAGRLESI